jgi:hypothetical protein
MRMLLSSCFVASSPRTRRCEAALWHAQTFIVSRSLQRIVQPRARSLELPRMRQCPT